MQSIVPFAEAQLGDMLTSETLKGMNLKQFDSGATAGQIAVKMVTELLSQLGRSAPQMTEP